jgi:hypothetical protein
MKRWILAVGIVLSLMLVPALAAAQSSTNPDEGFIFRASGDVTIPKDETISTVIVADGNAAIEGNVTDFLMVISGNATVNGTVGGDIVMIDGDLNLGQASTVKNVTMYESNLVRADGATVTGELTEDANLVDFGWGAVVFSVLMWIGLTLVIIAAAMLFAWLGGRQLTSAGDMLQQRPGASILTAVVLLFGLPVLAFLAFITVIGIPIGLAILLVVIPALWIGGYLVTGARIGQLLMRTVNVHNLIVAAVVGVLLLQLISLIPALGPVVSFLAATYGAGGLVYWMVGQPGRRHEAAVQPSSQPAA